MADTRCGFVAIVGRPNVGKSTLMNHMLGQKLSITSRKPQTTRHQIHGVNTVDNIQTIFVDTPGMHQGQKSALNRYMNRAADSSLADVDLIIFVVDRIKWTDEDKMVLDKVKSQNCPVIIAVNKVDFLEDKSVLLPHLQMLQEALPEAELFPISALRGQNIDVLEKRIGELLPENDFIFPEDQITDKSSRFMAAELVREKIMRQLGDELPYSMAVEIEEFKYDEKGVLHIHALILVERAGQKNIVIGKRGARLKLIGQEARKEMELTFDCKVMLNTWVKVKSGWSDDERALQSLGYHDREQ